MVVHGSRSGEVLRSLAGSELRLGAAKLSKRPVSERRSEESSYRGNGGRGMKKGTMRENLIVPLIRESARSWPVSHSE